MYTLQWMCNYASGLLQPHTISIRGTIVSASISTGNIAVEEIKEHRYLHTGWMDVFFQNALFVSASTLEITKGTCKVNNIRGLFLFH